MSDPLSISASVVGLIVPALHGTRLLLDDVQQLKSAPKTIKRLEEDIYSVDTALGLLQKIEEKDWELLGAGVTEQSKKTISGCTQACDLFRTDLQQWIKHSEDGKIAWQDRAKVGFFKQKQINAMSEQLSNCQLSITSVVTIATFHVTQEVKKMISLKQIEVKGAITTTGKQLAVVENRLEELDLGSDDEEIVDTEGKSKAIGQIEEELNAVRESRKLLNDLLAKAQEDVVMKAAVHPGQQITATFGNQNSGFQAGNINGGVNGITFGGK